jgi:UDP-2-acetamido-3-amino-2,3-dideoxy-glucuronate N-acetyltransferase
MTKIWHPELSNISPLAHIGEDCVIHSHVWIGDHVIIGNGCKIEAFCFLPEGVILEDNVFLGPRVTFTNDKHPPSGHKNWLRTLVRKGASIGASVTILPGLTIGKNAKVGAGSVVTKSILDDELWVGVPAKKLGKLNIPGCYPGTRCVILPQSPDEPF